ncbi:GTP-binding protein, partial [Nanoarchaeota archaeon]
RKRADVERIRKAFPQYKVVGISAKKNINMDKLYKAMFEVVK